jgi:hypothetical protein
MLGESEFMMKRALGELGGRGKRNGRGKEKNNVALPETLAAGLSDSDMTGGHLIFDRRAYFSEYITPINRDFIMIHLYPKCATEHF